MSQADMRIFTRTFDLLAWVLRATNDFPKAHRFSLTQRLLAPAFDLRERIEEANLRHNILRLERLAQADEAIARLRVYVRLAAQLASSSLPSGVDREDVKASISSGGFAAWLPRAAKGPFE